MLKSRFVIPRRVRPSMLIMAGMVLLSIAGIQYYYIYIAYKAQEALFDKKVHESLAHVTYVMEKNEISSQFRNKLKSGVKHHREVALLNTLDSLNQELFKSLRRYGVDSSISDSVARVTREKISYQVAMDQYGEYINNIDTQKIATQEKTVDLLDVFEINAKKKLKQEKIKDNRLLVRLFGDVESFLRRSYLISDVISDFFNVNRFFPIESRLDSFYVDSLLRQEFEARNIKTPFYFTIYSSRRDTFVYQPPKPILEKLKASPYRLRLFPSDMFGLPDYLIVYFPKKSSYIYSQSINMFIISISLILIVLVVFLYLLYIFYQQKMLSESKSEFINNMAHELKTPLSTIKLACDMLVEDDLLTEEKNKLLQIISSENERMMNMAQQILQSVIIKKGKLELNKERCHVHDILSQAIQKIDFWVKNKHGQISTIFEAKHDLILADPVHMENVFYNILENAYKYCEEEPSIVVRTYNKNGSIYVSIVDNGIGIPPEDIDKIFDMLYRVNRGNVHNVKGFGVGLHYVKSVLDLHGFTIQVKSELQKGSEFVIKMSIYEANKA